ncbi:hypothetical protein BGZ58_007218 [Dissophora ornata]|nr:hypothetical protein BGZ58_007218 [Dissophora ornata]
MKTNEWTSTFGLQPTTSTTPIITATSSTSTPTSTPTSSGSPPTSGGSPPVWLIILGIIIALIILIVAIVIAIRYRGRLRRANKGDGDDADHVIKDGTYDSSKDPNEYVKKEKHRYSDLRGPEAENNPFGFLQFSERRGPSTAGLGAKDDRSALPTNGARRYSHLRGPSTAGTKAHRDVPSESPRNPTEGSDQFGNSDNGPRRASRLRGPAATRMDAHEEEQDDWASLYMGIDEDSNYIPPPLPPRTSGSRRARPQRPRNPEYPPPPTSADKDLPTPPKKVKDRVRRAPATYERESVFGYVDGTPTRGAPQEFAWETK